MDIQDRIVQDVDELFLSVEEKLDALKLFCIDGKYEQMLGNRLISLLRHWDKRIRDCKNSPCSLVVCGEFKRGKSSLINALLGEDVVPTNVTTETVSINRISYGEHANAAILSGGRKIMLSDEELCRDKLMDIMKQTSEKITQIEIHRPIECLKDYVIIDTPGLNDVDSQFNELAESAIRNADAVLYLFSVESPLSLNEQIFLRTMIMPQKYTDLFIVANFADSLRKKDFERMKQFVSERIHQLLPSQNVALLSALDERCRQVGDERPNEDLEQQLGENFNAFRNALNQTLEARKQILIPTRIHRLVEGMKRELADEICCLREGLDLNEKQFEDARLEREQNYALCETQQSRDVAKMSRLLRSMKGETENWITELLKDMEDEVATLNSVSNDDLKKYYTVYCIDTIQNAINLCVDTHLQSIYDELDEIDSQYFKGASLDDASTECNFRFTLNKLSWTKGDSISYIASMFPQWGLISLVVDGVTGALRKSELRKDTHSVLDDIKAQYPKLVDSASKAIKDTYEQIESTLKKQFEFRAAEVLEKLRLQNEQLERVVKQSDDSKAAMRAAVDQIDAVLSSLDGI